MSLFPLPLKKGGSNALLCLCLLLTVAFPAVAGPGHDHGPAEPVASGPTSPRLVAVSESYELVAILKDQELTVYLDRLKDTSPVTDAKIEMVLDGETHIAAPQSDGTYKLKAQSLSKPGDHEVIVTIVEGGASDLLVGAIKIPDEEHEHAHEAAEEEALTTKFVSWPVLTALASFAGLFIGGLVTLRTGLIIGLLILGSVVSATAVLAGPGHDHGGGTTVMQGDAPKRLPDGEIFLPKPTQRLLEIRTEILSPQTATAAHKLIGRIIPDPNRSGLVQSTIAGRLKPSDRGLPVLGQTVKAGDILAFVEPSFAPIDASDLRQTAGDLDQRIAILDAQITRQRKLVSSRVSSRATLEDLEIERAGLFARSRQLRKSRLEPEALVAPVDGVIADVRVVVGQVVNRADTLFRIVDPSSLWVEAFSFHSGAKPESVTARAKTDEGRIFDLKFVGRSRALQQQASVIHFSIPNPTKALSIGSPVKVLVEKGNTVEGLIIPRRAVAQAPNGQLVTFKRLEPERYLPVAVRLEDLDGERVHITSGLKPGDQIIVKGAPLVNQIR